MNHCELLAELVACKALIVHCSRAGKGDEAIGGLLFSNDLQNAIDICAKDKELCCSVIWPQHTKTFGAVGIILRPRSIKSITSICTVDGGTHLNPRTGRREGAGVPFSKQGVMDTFGKATDYNEWNVENADTIGVFVHPTDPLEVAKRVLLREIPGYDPAMGNGAEQVVVPVPIRLAEVAAKFPGLPIYSFRGADIVRLDGARMVSINPSDLYGRRLTLLARCVADRLRELLRKHLVPRQ